MNTISLNGRIFNGSRISVRNGVVTIDGTVQKVEDAKGIVEIRVLEGVIAHLDTDASVNCNAITGNVNAGGSVNCDNMAGSVSAGGSVNCDNVGGSVSAGGSVRYGRSQIPQVA